MADLDTQIERAAKQALDMQAQVTAWRESQPNGGLIWTDLDACVSRLDTVVKRLTRAAYRLKIADQEAKVAQEQADLAALNATLGNLP